MSWHAIKINLFLDLMQGYLSLVILSLSSECVQQK